MPDLFVYLLNDLSDFEDAKLIAKVIFNVLDCNKDFGTYQGRFDYC